MNNFANEERPGVSVGVGVGVLFRTDRRYILDSECRYRKLSLPNRCLVGLSRCHCSRCGQPSLRYDVIAINIFRSLQSTNLTLTPK